MNGAPGNECDVVVPFLFERLPVRGALIQLQRSWARMQLGQNYQAPVMTVLGQAAAATGLLVQSLKFKGTITLQINGDGPLSMLVMQSTHDLEMRGMANAAITGSGISYRDLVQQTRCAITIDTGSGERPYQGIVEMLGDSLSASLQNYFTRSVQVESHLALVADGSVCGGILLQQMPQKELALEDDWQRLGLLAQTLRVGDFAPGIGVPLVGRLFAEDDVRVFDARPAAFRCRCSRRRAEEALRLLGEDETRTACEEQGGIDVTCEYCGQRRSFDAVDVSRLFTAQAMTGPDTVQ